MAVTTTGTGSTTRIPAGREQAGVPAGQMIPADPTLSGLNPGERLSPDPATAEEQATRITPQ